MVGSEVYFASEYSLGDTQTKQGRENQFQQHRGQKLKGSYLKIDLQGHLKQGRPKPMTSLVGITFSQVV